MTYVSRKEKVFNLPDSEEDSSTSLVNSSDQQLNITTSFGENGSISLDEYQKYQRECQLSNVKGINGAKSTGFKYIPIDALFTILMEKKDAYIQELLERQQKCTCGEKTVTLYQANRCNDSEDDKEALIRKDAEVVALKNRNAVLESELEECRGTLTKAMHKLENVEEILNENAYLQNELKYSEELIRLLEESKRTLEMELERRESQKEVDIDDFEKNDKTKTQDLQSQGDHNLLQNLYSERNMMKFEIDRLQNELAMARNNIEEMEFLKSHSQSILLNLEQISKENEIYRKKLEGMRHLEGCVEDLKNQALTLKEKFRREVHKSKDQLNQINTLTKEIEILNEEKERLQSKIAELSTLESELYSAQRKLNQFNSIIDENEQLNLKLCQLMKLESENEALRAETDRLKSTEMELDKSKIKIEEMRGDLTSHEEEIKSLVSQIEHLSQEYVDPKEYTRLKIELKEKIDIISQYENQLNEIPQLQDDLEQLQEKLQKCMDESMKYKKSVIQLQEELDACNKKCQQLEDLSQDQKLIKESQEEKLANLLSIVQGLVDCSSPSSEMYDEGRKEEISSEQSKSCIEDEYSDMSSPTHLMEQNLQVLMRHINMLKELVNLKDEKIKIQVAETAELRQRIASCSGCKEMQNYVSKLESDIVILTTTNEQLQEKNISKVDEEVKIIRLEDSLQFQKKALEFSKRMVKEMEEKVLHETVSRQMAMILLKMFKEEALLKRKEVSVGYLTEIGVLKSEIDLLKKLISELKEENKILQKMKIFTEFTGKKALENILKKLKGELLVLQNLSKPELEAECQSLHAEVKRLGDEADYLKNALEIEKRSKDYLEKELSLIQKELSSVTNARNKTQLLQDAATMTYEYLCQSEEIKKTLNDIQILKEENDEFVKEIALLQGQCKDFQDEVTVLHNNMDELEKGICNEKILTSRQKEEINSLNEIIKHYEKEIEDAKSEKEQVNEQMMLLREDLTAKETELVKTQKELIDLKNEILKLNTDTEILKNKLEESEENLKKLIEADGHHVDENKSSNDMIIKLEKEFEDLRKKLEMCQTAEEKLAVLRTKKDSLIVKVNCFESEVEFLKKKLTECDIMKSELEKLKTERKTLSDLQMNIESEEKLLSDIFGLREQVRLQQKEIELARSENTSLKNKLQELGKLLDGCKKSHKPSQIVLNTDASNLTNSDAPGDEIDTIQMDNSTSCEILGDTISIRDFKIEIAKIENKHKIKVQKLKEGNAEKIKKLIEQYEKESNCRNKAYNDSLNNIKSNYEWDIKKLVEKHKASILRLQNLHEDEVQELNTNYETQMEAMQTLNENVVNDLTSGAAEKCKITEKYNKEIKDIESKFQKLLKEKENQHMIEIANLRENLVRNVSDSKDMHKQNIDNLGRMYEENIARLEEKHNRELKKCKKNYLKKTEMMRHKYEDLIIEERKKYEEQLQIMLDRLNLGNQGDQVRDELQFVYLQEATKRPSSGTLELNKILQKIISRGLESLKFDELMLIHCKTCFATESFFEDLNMKVESQGDINQNGCPHTPLLKENREDLLKRIFILENEIAIKQLETHEAIISMESAEKCRMEELNALLISEREKNTELKMMLTNQARAQTDLKIESYMLDKQASLHETIHIEKVKELEVERGEKRRLEDELQKERANSKRLSLMLENERQRFKSQRKKDSEYIQAMRMRLEEALSHEQIMESQLDYEAQFRTKLEYELQSLQRSFNLIIDQPLTAPSFESKVVKDIKNFDQFESDKEEKLNTKIKNKVKSNANS